MIKVKPLLVSVAVLAALPSFAQAQSLEDRIRQLESQIGVMESTPGQGAGGSVELYGSLRTSLQYTDTETGSTTDDTNTEVKDEASRVGIRASVNMDDGWTATARGEWKAPVDDKFGAIRLGYVSLGKKGLGTVGIGQQWGGFYNFIGAVTDIANSGTPGGEGKVTGMGRLADLVTYTNKFGPVDVQVDTQFVDEFNRYTLSAGFSQEGMSVAASYDVEKDGANDTESLGLAASYNMKPFYVGLSYVTQEVDGSDPKPSAIDLSVSYEFGKNTLIGHYYTVDSDQAAASSYDSDGFLVSIQHKMNDQLRLWADLRLDDADGDDDAVAPNLVSDDVETTTLSLGARYDFSITN